jgi:hypothetical protein
MSTTPPITGEAPLSVAAPAKIAYSIPEFLAACSLGRTFVYQEISAGRLRARKAGRRTLIDAAEARRWFATLQEITASDEPSDATGSDPSTSIRDARKR